LNNIHLENTLIELGATINIMTNLTLAQLNKDKLQPTLVILKLDNKSKFHPIGVVDDVIITLSFWEYHMDLILIQEKNTREHFYFR
jgi:hypothetical protein